MKKACQAYERHWRDFCVDRNLEDRWLEELNTLSTFNLVGICEGHRGGRKTPSGKFPHINLKLKEKLLPDLIKDWENVRLATLHEVHKLFSNTDTYFNLELRAKIRAGRGRLVYQEEMILKMRRNQARVSENMDPDCFQWFEICIAAIKQLDECILNILTP